MKKKMTLVIWLLLVIMIMSSCAEKNQVIEQKETKGQESEPVLNGTDAALSVDETVHSSVDETSYYSVIELHSKEALIKYVKDNIKANEYGEPALFYIECPIEAYELKEIEISGNNIYYRFLPIGYELPQLPEESENDGAIAGYSESEDEEANRIQEDIENGIMPEDSPYELIPDLYIGWNYTHNGEHGLEWFVSQNQGVVFPVEDIEGMYYSDGFTLNNTFIGRMYYWVEDDCFFQATVPAALINDMQIFLKDRKLFIEGI